MELKFSLGGPTLLKHLGLIPLVHGSADGTIVYVIANRRLMGRNNLRRHNKRGII